MKSKVYVGRDPIVEEVRAIREELAAEHAYDVMAIVQALVRDEAQGGRKPVSLPSKPLPENQAAHKAG